MELYVRTLEIYDENRGLFNEIFDEFSVGLDE